MIMKFQEYMVAQCQEKILMTFDDKHEKIKLKTH